MTCFGIFGDMFLSRGIIFRIYTNCHPKDSFIASPIYKLIDNRIIRLDRAKFKVREFYKKIPNSNIYTHIVPKDKIKEYYPCLNPEIKVRDEFYRDYIAIKKKLKTIGIKNIGITGSGLFHLRNNLSLHNKSDIDLIVYGKKDCLILKKGLNKIYDQEFISYKKCLKKLYFRRKNKSKLNIDYKTIKEVEANKPIGILNNRHINITPTCYKDKINFKKNLGMIEGVVEIEKLNEYSIPSRYKIKSIIKGKVVSSLKTNFFYYGLCPEKAKLKIKGNLVLEKDNNIYSVYLYNWGDHKNFFMKTL